MARPGGMADGLLYTKGSHLYVPRASGLRKELMRECHDTLWAGHPGWHRALALLERGYYWPNIRDDVINYVKTCLVCQQDKVDRERLGYWNPYQCPKDPGKASQWTESRGYLKWEIMAPSLSWWTDSPSMPPSSQHLYTVRQRRRPPYSSSTL